MTTYELELIQQYLDTDDISIIDHVINHPWAYSVSMVQIAIALKAKYLTK